MEEEAGLPETAPCLLPPHSRPLSPSCVAAPGSEMAQLNPELMTVVEEGPLPQLGLCGGAGGGSQAAGNSPA